MIETDSETFPRLNAGFFKDLVRHSADAIIAIDTEQRIVFANPASQDMFGYSADDMIGQDLSMLLPERFKGVHRNKVDGFLSSGEEARYMGKREAQIVGLRADGQEIRIGASIVRAQADGKAVFAAIMRDISWRMEMVDMLADMARLDPLTGQLNRRAFLSEAASECSRAQRYDTGLAFLFLDLDRFKQLNDTFGHDAGDEILRAFAELVHDELRTVDSLCRWGGEEFIVMLTNADLDGACAAAERIRSSVEEKVFDLPGGRTTPVTVSIGICYRGGREVDVHEQIKQADTALYQAKRSGRNRIEVWRNEGSAS